MPQWEQKVCLFLSNLKVVFDTAALIKHEFCSVRLKAYIGILLCLTLASDILHVCVIDFSLGFHVDNMLRLRKKDLTAMVKKMKIAS